MTASATTPVGPTRPFYWSVRRELWEHRSIYMGPLIAGGLILLGTALAHLPGTHVHMGGDLQPGFAGLPFMIIAGIIMITALIVAFAYCLSALNAERRDRSILFWKSLPVSDLTTVLSKAAVPTIILPVVAFAAILATQLIVLVATATSFDSVSEVITTTLTYGPLVLGLWYAPVYGWLLLVSSWAKRGAFLWAILPPLGICVVEGLAFHTKHFAELLSLRLNGGFGAVFAFTETQSAHSMGMPHVTREMFLTSPDLWGGILVGAVFLAAAVWQRRRAEPV